MSLVKSKHSLVSGIHSGTAVLTREVTKYVSIHVFPMPVPSRKRQQQSTLLETTAKLQTVHYYHIIYALLYSQAESIFSILVMYDTYEAPTTKTCFRNYCNV